jgi:hypothetical protein
VGRDRWVGIRGRVKVRPRSHRPGRGLALLVPRVSTDRASSDTGPRIGADTQRRLRSQLRPLARWASLLVGNQRDPDFPSAAQAILNGYEEATGGRLDGVILADPFALQALLGVVGPVELPGYGIEIDHDTVVSFTTNEAYMLCSTIRRRVSASWGK